MNKTLKEILYTRLNSNNKNFDPSKIGNIVALHACSYNTVFLERYGLYDLSIRINELTDVSMFNCSFVSTIAREEYDRLKQYGGRHEN